MRHESTARPSVPSEWTYAAVVVLVGFAVTGALVAIIRGVDSRLIESQFRSDVAELNRELDRQFSQATSGLRDLGALLSIKPDISALEFQRFAEPLLGEHPYVRAFSWNPIVRHADRAEWEHSVRAEGQLPQGISEKSHGGTMIPARIRERYVVVRYIEPGSENHAALGYDVASEPTRRIALDLARDTGLVSATEPLVLVQAPDRGDGALAFQPVHGGVEPGTTGSSETLRGYAVAVVLLGDIVEMAMDRRSFNDVRTLLRLDSGNSESIVDSHPKLDGQSGSLVVRAPFDWANRRWVFEFHPTPAYLAAKSGSVASIALVGGLLLTILLGLLVYGLANRATRLRQEIAIRKAAEQALERNRERLRLAVSAAAEGVWDWNIETGETYFSPAWKAALGYTEDAVPPRIEFWERIVHPDDRPAVAQALSRHFAGETQRYECENRLRRADGTWRWNLDSGRVVERDSDGRPVRMVGIDRDITERKESEEKQARIDQQLRETQKLESLGVLAGSVAHDFNNILMGILGKASEGRRHHNTDTLHERLAQIKDLALKAAELCRQLLMYAGRADVRTERVELSSLIDDSLQLLTTSIAKRARLELELTAGLPSTVGDVAQIRQILLNLTLNAAEALEHQQEGKIRIATGKARPTEQELARAQVGSALAGRDCVYVEISDNGCGMSEEVRARLFEPFYTSKATGRGLGLATVLGTVRAHGGALFLETAVNQGSTFRLVLPVENREHAQETPVLASVPSRFRSDVVLVVDDEESARRSAVSVVTQLGYRTEAVASGSEARKRVAASSPAVGWVLLDVVMPDMDGAETYERLRRDHPTVPVVLASGHVTEHLMTRFANLHAQPILTKPLSPTDLRATIDRLVHAG